jgi:pantoate ligase/cytidylate kinase
VTEPIRTSEVTGNVSTIAAQPEVRKFMVKQQRSFGKKGGMVAEGRDIGTNVFPDAELKIFLTASLQERARRRLKELQEMGETISAEQLEKEIALRDEKDSTRDIAPLRQASDAIEILTDGLTIDQVLQKIVNLYQRVMGNRE